MVIRMFTLKIHMAFVGLISLSLLIHVSQASPTYSQHACTNSTTGGTLTSNSTYLSNLNLLLSSLTSNTTIENGFYNTVVGRGTPNAVIGQFLCRGDVNTTFCQECVAAASKEVLRRCPLEKGAVIWYDECSIRYAEGSDFIPNPGIVPSTSLTSTQNVSEPDRFEDLLAGVMDSLATEAANSNSGKKFATEEKNFTSTQTVYSLVQCTPDLSVGDCDTCLRSAIAFFPSCCAGKQGGRNLLPSCSVRYETFPFYNTTASQPLLPPGVPEKGKSSSLTIIAIIVPISIAVTLFLVGFLFLRRKAKNKAKDKFVRKDSVRSEINSIDSLHFDLETIEAATNNFSDDNKIGEGGFGAVYKGTLFDGQKIAVKRLSGSSGQGAQEFKNEATLVAKLQHRNLVRLLGFCLEGEEKILVYEYVPNKSLDYFLFDNEKQSLLGWTRRYNIITGIARGMLYMHEDSRLRIIHRDLKASNILLDGELNPKISDFGMARIFVVDQIQGNTNRIVGTYGYMSPEYAMHGHFSVKSDVFSFGVLVLEIISGKKNNSFYQSHGSGDLLTFAWEHWKSGTPLEVLDPTLRHAYSRNEVMRCIHIGLLCVQENPAARPTMATIVLVLNSYSVTLPLPQEPARLHRNRTQPIMPTRQLHFDQATSPSAAWSVNDESMITQVYPR
ncbi:cysteine-rich receptor-like protein kinase 25 [Ziziphus jujuba]|uniref:Cysteine-rich receptor-like protein kinase 25 n=1 Tax=Ziziphus jujuba TaxID=326968 RepID=A0A6P6G676_ZIZJJ|nr:cysteine-rich receptor-like protein kinase 25 [Ziziphus jujuba]